MLEKIYHVTCDYCGEEILSLYNVRSVKDTEERVKNLGGVVKGDNHFCNEECYNNYLKS